LEKSSICSYDIFFILGDKHILQLRKRPKEISSKKKTTRKPFGKKVIKVLSIPAITNGYNYYMGAVTEVGPA
jgi:hypothetical protein